MVQNADEIALRLRRAAFNRALADGDLPVIEGLLARDVVLVTGTDSGVLAGRKAQLQAWRREFAAPAGQRNRYVRTPQAITLSAVEPIALEQGQWASQVGDQPGPSGSYAAKWRHTGGDWVIEAEIFVTLA